MVIFSHIGLAVFLVPQKYTEPNRAYIDISVFFVHEINYGNKHIPCEGYLFLPSTRLMVHVCCGSHSARDTGIVCLLSGNFHLQNKNTRNITKASPLLFCRTCLSTFLESSVYQEPHYCWHIKTANFVALLTSPFVPLLPFCIPSFITIFYPHFLPPFFTPSFIPILLPLLSTPFCTPSFNPRLTCPPLGV